MAPADDAARTEPELEGWQVACHDAIDRYKYVRGLFKDDAPLSHDEKHRLVLLALGSFLSQLVDETRAMADELTDLTSSLANGINTFEQNK